MKRLFTTLSALLLIIALFGQSDTLSGSFIHNDSLRSYLLYVPAAYDGTEDWPLVINYHQFGWSPGDYMAHTGMNAVADTGHFLIAYPQGLSILHPISMQQGPGWNESETLSVNDDVGFTDALVSHVSASHQVDPARVYATGWGMGAGFAQKVQCDLADVIAATALVSSIFTDFLLQTCTPERPVSMLLMHGTADPFIPFAPDPQHPIITMGLQATVDFLQANNNCSADSSITEISDSNTEDGSTVTLTEYVTCDAETEIVVYRINGGGHAWPGGGALPEFFGPVNRDINASSEIWNFFNRNPLSQPTTSADDFAASVFERVSIYPNPSYGELSIELALKEAGTVQFRLFTVLGQPVGNTIGQYFSSGTQLFTWNPKVDQLSTGPYLLWINVGNEILTRPVMIHRR